MVPLERFRKQSNDSMGLLLRSRIVSGASFQQPRCGETLKMNKNQIYEEKTNAQKLNEGSAMQGVRLYTHLLPIMGENWKSSSLLSVIFTPKGLAKRTRYTGAAGTHRQQCSKQGAFLNIFSWQTPIIVRS